jgi:hypothetical protein
MTERQPATFELVRLFRRYEPMLHDVEPIAWIGAARDRRAG